MKNISLIALACMAIVSMLVAVDVRSTSAAEPSAFLSVGPVASTTVSASMFLATPDLPTPTLADIIVDSGRAHWTYPGNIKSHLVGGHGYTAEQLAGMTVGQLETLHDQTHETGFVSTSLPLPLHVPQLLKRSAGNVKDAVKETVQERELFQRRPIRSRFGGRCGIFGCGG